MKSKKIFLVSRCAWTLYNFRAGLLRELLAQGFVVKGGGSGGDGYEPHIRTLGVPFKLLPVDKKGINLIADLHLMATLYRWYRRERPDIVHNFTIKPVIYSSLAARLANVPRIINTVTGLGYVFTNPRANYLRMLVEKMYLVALKCADFTFFQNFEDLAYFQSLKIVNTRKTKVLSGSGVDCHYFKPLPRSQPVTDNTTFLMVSRILKDKGIYEYVEAARKVKTLFPNTNFQLIGRRDTRNPTVVSNNELQKWQRNGIVKYLGEVADVRTVIRNADIVVLPSYREGIPRALLEAAAMAKPVITTNAIGCREVVEHYVTGLIVPIRDSGALAEAMIRLIECPVLRKKMGAKGRVKMLREFDEQFVIKQTMKQYR